MVRVGKNTRINHTVICELVSIGCDCVIAHGVMFFMMLLGWRSRSRRSNTVEKTEVGDMFQLAVWPPYTVRICGNVVIGAGQW